MNDNLSQSDYKISPNTEQLDFDLVYEKLSRYCDYLQRLVNEKNNSSCGNGIQQLDTMAEIRGIKPN